MDVSPPRTEKIMGTSGPISLPVATSEIEENSQCLQDINAKRKNHKTPNDNPEPLKVQTHTNALSRGVERFRQNAPKLEIRIIESDSRGEFD